MHQPQIEPMREDHKSQNHQLMMAAHDCCVVQTHSYLTCFHQLSWAIVDNLAVVRTSSLSEQHLMPLLSGKQIEPTKY